MLPLPYVKVQKVNHLIKVNLFFVILKTKEMKRLLLLSLLIVNLDLLHAQGYIYVHKRAVSEDIAGDVPFTLSGGTNYDFALNDDGSNLFNIYDMGASHGNPGGGQLWAVAAPTYTYNASHTTPGYILWRDAASSRWIRLTSPLIALSIDGMGDKTAVYVSVDGSGYIYDNGVHRRIWDPANANHEEKLIDIASGGPRSGTSGGDIIAVTASGKLYKYTGSFNPGSSATDAWGIYRNTVFNSGVLRVDIFPGNAATDPYGAIQKTNGSVYSFKTAATNVVPTELVMSYPLVKNLDFIKFYDVAWADDGRLYATANLAGSYTGANYNGVYTVEYSRGGWHNSLNWYGIQTYTGGPGGQVWGANIPEFVPGIKKIYSKTADFPGVWIDDERIKNATLDNAMMIPVNAGSYTLTETVPTGWRITDIDIYDPSGNSSRVNRTARLNVADGEVVHVIFTNARNNNYDIADNTDCASMILEDFGSGTAEIGPALTRQTSFHYNGVSRYASADGYYNRIKTTAGTNWWNKDLTDHTGLNNGYFAIFNASYMPDYFFYQTVIGLKVGETYEFSFWAADLSSGSPRRSIVEFGVRNIQSGNVEASINTGEVTDSTWKEYSFKFTATTDRLQLYLKNMAPGGDGNDIAIDDISFRLFGRPVSNISGPEVVCTQNATPGTTYQFNANPAGGVWTSLNTNLITINPANGVATPVANAGGEANIKYEYTDPNTGCKADSIIEVTLLSTCTPLPITLESFTAQNNGNNVILKWHVSDAKNFSRFEVEKATNGKDFEKITSIGFDVSKSTYSYIDNQLLKGVYQYRLNMIDIDGQQKYSDIKEVVIDKTADQPVISVVPNPVRNQMYVIGANAGSVIRILDITGRVVSEEKFINKSVPVNVSKISAGTYILQVVENGIIKGVTRFVKQ